MEKRERIAVYFSVILAGLLLNLLPALVELLLGAHVPYGLSHAMMIIQLAIMYGIPWIISSYLRNRERQKNTQTDNLISVKKKIIITVIGAPITVFACYFFRNAIYCLMYGLFNLTPDITNGTIHLHDLLNPQIFASIISMVLLTPIFEELFYRGVLVQHRENTVKSIICIIASVLCFEFAHDSVEQVLLILPFAFFAALIVNKTGSLMFSITTHILLNFVGLFTIPLGEIVFSPAYVITYQEKKLSVIFGAFNCLLCLLMVFLLVFLISVTVGTMKKNETQTKNDDSIKQFNIGFATCCFVFCLLQLISYLL